MVVATVVAAECTEAAAASTAVVWGAQASTAVLGAEAFMVLRVAAGFAVRRLALAALTAATTLPGAAADDLPVGVIITGMVEG